MSSAALIMSRLEKESIKAHLNQDIKTLFAVCRLPETSSDLCPQMVMWQTILPKDIQNTETPSNPMQETAAWGQLWGPFCEKFKLLPHTHSLEGRRELPHDSKGLSPWTCYYLCLDKEAQTICPQDQIYCPDVTKAGFPGVREISQIENI